MHPAYSDLCFTRPVIHIGVEFAQSQESATGKKRPGLAAMLF